MRTLGRGAHACHGQIELVDRVLGIARGILDRAADRTGLGGKTDRLGRGGRLVGEAVLQIDIDRQIRRLGDRPAVGDHFGPADGAVGAAERIGEAEAGGGQRLEAECRQQLGRAGVPRIGNDEGAGPLVQGAKGRCFLRLASHLSLLVRVKSGRPNLAAALSIVKCIVL